MYGIRTAKGDYNTSTAPQQLHHNNCTTTTAPQQLYNTSCNTTTAPHQLHHNNNCTTTIAQQQLHHTSCTTPAAPHQLHHINCTTSTVQHQLPAIFKSWNNRRKISKKILSFEIQKNHAPDVFFHCLFLSHATLSFSQAMWPVKNRQISIKVAQKWFH